MLDRLSSREMSVLLLSGTVLLGTFIGVQVGTNVGLEPIDRSVRDNAYGETAAPHRYAVKRTSASTYIPDQYPLETADGVFQVSDLALRGELIREGRDAALLTRDSVTVRSGSGAAPGVGAPPRSAVNDQKAKLENVAVTSAPADLSESPIGVIAGRAENNYPKIVEF